MLLRNPFLVLALALLLGACSSTQHAYLDTLKLALRSVDDATLSLTEVKQSDYDLIYIQVDDRARATMVLAYLEHGQHKWLSGDHALLVVEQGRIVRTLGFDNDLHYVSNRSLDPIRLQNGQLPHREWTRLTDWQFGFQSGYQLHSVIEEVAAETIEVLEQGYDTRLFKEVVHFEGTKQQVENFFWFERSSGELLKSRQQLAPHWPVLTMTYISRAARIAPVEQPES